MREIGVGDSEHVWRRQFHGNALRTAQQEQAFALRSELQHATIIRGVTPCIVGGSRYAPGWIGGRHRRQRFALADGAHEAQRIFRYGPWAIALHGIDGRKHAAARIEIHFQCRGERHHAAGMPQTSVAI